MEKYDGIIVLGAQIGVNDKGKMTLAKHTEMRVTAAGILWATGNVEKLILSGGYNFIVRYDIDLSVPVFGTPKSNRKPDFTEEARTEARWYRSEASLMSEFLKTEYHVWPESLILEEDSKTTTENAKFCKDILIRFGWDSGAKIGLLTQLYHMEKAREAFFLEDLNLNPVFAEDVLAAQSPGWTEKIRDYYSTPKGGKQWDVDGIMALLSKRESLSALL